MTNKISEPKGLYNYYSQIPNLVDDMNLSVYAYRLYGHLKRVAGEDGLCWQSTQTLAESCGMSVGSISKYKKELVDRKLIKIEKKSGDNGAYDEITITDIWLKNMSAYSGGSSSGEQGSSPHEQRSSSGETKNNPIKNNTVRIVSRKRDTRLDHPAIQAYRKEAHLHVPITWRDTVIEVVGDDVKTWAELVRDWVGHGWNKANVKDMLSAYQNGGIKKRAPQKNVTSVVDDMRKEYT